MAKLGARANTRKPIKKSTRSKSDGATSTSISKNRNAQWRAYRTLQDKADKAWVKLRSDVKEKASPEILVRDRDELLLLLGECNYMAGECLRIENMRKQKK